ncbi:hypothetical protein BRADI_3g09525v3 [Brachypodium distachyon]|uniref:Uncharacterized protein n=1 Tax=Brachypodium distachyon TaxID=15368 RepID=A0A2K2CW69_BRADI|nr:hypothetical protein BRADI_3g09525v3 [Brachypodium distachyon]
MHGSSTDTRIDSSRSPVFLGSLTPLVPRRRPPTSSVSFQYPATTHLLADGSL